MQILSNFRGEFIARVCSFINKSNYLYVIQKNKKKHFQSKWLSILGVQRLQQVLKKVFPQSMCAFFCVLHCSFQCSHKSSKANWSKDKKEKNNAVSYYLVCLLLSKPVKTNVLCMTYEINQILCFSRNNEGSFTRKFLRRANKLATLMQTRLSN